MWTLKTQEKIQTPVGFFNKSIRRKRNEIIKKWAGMSIFTLFTYAGIPEKGEGEEGSKQGRLIGGGGSFINWSLCWPSYPSVRFHSITKLIALADSKYNAASKSGASYHAPTKTSPS